MYAALLGCLGLLLLLAKPCSAAAGKVRCPQHLCHNVLKCPQQLELLQSGTTEDRLRVTAAICGYEGLQAKVCCESHQSSNYSERSEPVKQSNRIEGVHRDRNDDRPQNSQLTGLEKQPNRRENEFKHRKKTGALISSVNYNKSNAQNSHQRSDKQNNNGQKEVMHQSQEGEKSDRHKSKSAGGRPLFRPTIEWRPGPSPVTYECGVPTATQRIVGGARTGLAEHPWVVAIRYKDPRSSATAVLCAGTLVSHHYVVTAAHCLDNNYLKGWTMFSLHLGEWRLNTDPDCHPSGHCAPPSVVVGAKDTVVHPQYSRRQPLSNDIALIQLNQTVSFNRFVRPLCLPPTVLSPSDVATGDRFLAIGWGQTAEGRMSDVLMGAVLTVTSPSVCKEVFPNFFHLNGRQLCLGSAGVDTCLGDSGGPVLKLTASGRYILMGLTSFGRLRCGVEGLPAVYTSVYHYKEWISSTII